MGSRVQPLTTAALRPVRVTAEEVALFSGKRPPLDAYRLEPVEDQDAQYELALTFDDSGEFDDVDDSGDANGEGGGDADGGAGEVNPLYGIPFGVSMLVAYDGDGRPAGFITFRHDLREGPRNDQGRRRAHYDFKIFVFMVRDDLRGRGYGSALAVGCLTAIRDDLRAICGCCPESVKPDVSVRFVGEGKSRGGLRLLDRVARTLGLLSGEVCRDYGLAVSKVAAEIL